MRGVAEVVVNVRTASCSALRKKSDGGSTTTPSCSNVASTRVPDVTFSVNGALVPTAPGMTTAATATICDRCKCGKVKKECKACVFDGEKEECQYKQSKRECCGAWSFESFSRTHNTRRMRMRERKQSLVKKERKGKERNPITCL